MAKVLYNKPSRGPLKASKWRGVFSKEYYEKKIQDLFNLNKELIEKYKELLICTSRDINFVMREKNELQRELILTRKQKYECDVRLEKFKEDYYNFSSLMKNKIDNLLETVKVCEYSPSITSYSSTPYSKNMYKLSDQKRDEYRSNCFKKYKIKYCDLNVLEEDSPDMTGHNPVNVSSTPGTPSIYDFEPISIIEIDDSLNSFLMDEETPKRRSIFSTRFNNSFIIKSPLVKKESPKFEPRTRQQMKKMQISQPNSDVKNGDSKKRGKKVVKGKGVKRGRPKKKKLEEESDIKENLSNSFEELFAD